MTREAAIETAEREARLFGLSMTVYRLKAWPEGVFGVRTTNKLPFEAEQHETMKPPQGDPGPVQAVSQTGPQRSLF